MGPPLIVVGVDGSRRSGAALRWAVAEAAARSGRVRAVMCWTWAWSPFGARFAAEKRAAGGRGSGARRGGRRDMLTLEELTELRLRESVADAVGEHPPVQIQCKVVQGAVPQALALAAENAELLVVGTRGYVGAKRMLFGSVSRDVVAHAPCTVVVVREGRAGAFPAAARVRPRAESRTDSSAESRTGSRTESRPGSRADSRAGLRTDPRAGSRTDPRAGSRTDPRGDSSQGSRGDRDGEGLVPAR
ncbi:universal stress protein [Streptomyces sp. NPDC004111]|uniref:universal stress protein n=1 Tax=Streptomyces sp. NPDC004111 TaxID=3364690 RepID=UPI0036B9AD43